MTSASVNTNNIDDFSAISEEASNLFSNDRVLDAARMLRSSNNTDQFNAEHHEILNVAQKFEIMMEETDNSDGSWKSIAKSYNTCGFMSDLDYRLSIQNDTHTKVEVKIVTVIPKDLLVPLLALLNETDLYQKWIPEVSKSEKIQQTGRVSQLLRLLINLPWPLPKLEFLYRGLGCDDVETSKNIMIKLDTLKEGDVVNGYEVPPPPDEGSKVHRFDINGGFLFEPCTEDYMKRAIEGKFIKKEGGTANSSNNINISDYLCLSLYFQMESSRFRLPESILKLMFKVSISASTSRFFRAAKDIKNKKKKEHCKRIQEKREEIYDWMDERASYI